jgi:tetratricopeptide (TPR) repeat protein
MKPSGMTSTHWRKLAYVPLVLAAIGAGVLLSVAVGGWQGLLVAVLLMLLPGRIQGFVYRDFFRGRRLFSQGQYADAVPHFERFLDSVRARPWIKHLLWLQFAAYTTDIEAMTLNNLGGAHIQLGDLDAGERYLREALAIDARYAMALYNLSRVAALRGDEADAERLLAEAARLGFSGSGLDALLQASGERLAHLEGRGAGA